MTIPGGIPVPEESEVPKSFPIVVSTQQIQAPPVTHVLPFPRRASSTEADRTRIDHATRDIYQACRTAFLLLKEVRSRMGLNDLPPL